MEISEPLRNAVRLVEGFALFVLGISFAWKFVQAAFSGKVEYWAGLQHFGFLFSPITLFISPLFCHLPYNPNNSLIQMRQSLWVHLVFGPVFFIAALMCMCSGADLMGIPGSNSLNYVLTCGRSDVPPFILYSPPPETALFDMGQYRFPFVKKATKTILRFVTTVIPTNKKDSYNAYVRKGEDVSGYTKSGIPWIDEDDEDDPATRPIVPISQQTSSNSGRK